MECLRFVDEKIGETDSAEFREHRAGCAACRRDLDELREVRGLYRRASAEKYRGGVPRLRKSRAVWIPMAAAAAALVGVFTLILSGPRKEDVTSAGEAPTGSAVFVRIALEPWAVDRQISVALDDCWQRLEKLEEKRGP